MSAKDVQRRAKAVTKIGTQKLVTLLEPGTGPLDLSGIPPEHQARFSRQIRARKMTKVVTGRDGSQSELIEYLMAAPEIERLASELGQVPGENWQIVDGTDLEQDAIATVIGWRIVTGDELDVLHYFRVAF